MALLYLKIFCYSYVMKKSFLIFIGLVLLLVVAKTAYNKYCESKPEGCKKEKVNYEKDGLPKEGIDY